MITVITPLEVPPEEEGVLQETWKRGMEIARHRPGFLAARLQRSCGSNARFRFIAMSMWESSQAYSDALDDKSLVAILMDLEIPVSPSIYEIVAEVTADER